MKLTFQSKLIAVIIVITIVSGVALTYVNIADVKKSYEEDMVRENLTLVNSLEKDIATSGEFEKIVDQMMGERLLAASEAINLIPISQMSNEKIMEIAPKVNIDNGIYVIDSQRRIIYSDIVDYVGWQFPEDHPMNVVFDGSQKSYVEDLREDMIDGTIVKYGGMALDTPGYFVQLAINAETIKQIKAKFSEQHLIEQLLGENASIAYAMTVDKEGAFTAGSEKMKKEEPYTEDFIVKAIKEGTQQEADVVDPETKERYYAVAVPYYEQDQQVGAVVLASRLTEMHNEIREKIMKSVVTTFVILLLSILLGIVFIRKTISPLKSLSSDVNRIAAGDFTVEQSDRLLEQRDELGVIASCINNMSNELSLLINQVKADADNLEEGSRQLSQIMDDTSSAVEDNARSMELLATSTNNQAGEVDKLLAISENLSQNIEKSKESIREVNQRMGQVDELSNKGEKIISDLAQITKDSIVKSESVSTGIQGVDETVQNMAEFMNRIRSISEQTNLLALNASIEAARAGEAGRGFAVVADEIRKLSEETNQTTEQVESIITRISDQTDVAVKDIGNIRKITDNQKTTLEDTLKIFGDIQQSIGQLVHSMDRVIEANDTIGTNKESILSAVNNLTDISSNLSSTSQELSASTEEQAASIEEVNNLTAMNRDLAKVLKDQVSRFITRN